MRTAELTPSSLHVVAWVRKRCPLAPTLATFGRWESWPWDHESERTTSLSTAAARRRADRSCTLSVQYTKILEMKLSQLWGKRVGELAIPSYIPPTAKREGPEHSQGKTVDLALVVWVTWTKGLGTKELFSVLAAACIRWSGWGRTGELT